MRRCTRTHLHIRAHRATVRLYLQRYVRAIIKTIACTINVVPIGYTHTRTHAYTDAFVYYAVRPRGGGDRQRQKRRRRRSCSSGGGGLSCLCHRVNRFCILFPSAGAASTYYYYYMRIYYMYRGSAARILNPISFGRRRAHT